MNCSANFNCYPNFFIVPGQRFLGEQKSLGLKWPVVLLVLIVIKEESILLVRQDFLNCSFNKEQWVT